MLLLLLVVTYLLTALVSTRWTDTIQLLLFTGAALLALRNATFRRSIERWIILAALLGTAVLIILVAISRTGGKTPSATLEGIGQAWIALLLVLAAELVIRQVLVQPAVTMQSIYGALSAYLIIGLMFASIYAAIWHFDNQKFFAQGDVISGSITAIFQYFSFSTLTTLGYGDYTSAVAGGRAVAMLEAIAGQIFLATLVARLVAQYRRAEND